MKDWAQRLGIELAERRWLPDGWIRRAIRGICKERWESTPHQPEAAAEWTQRFLEAMRSSPVALLPQAANAQHYEVPPEFFRLMLGPALKYSCGYWEGESDLQRSEQCALERTCQHAQLEDGQRVLDVGCGWGSLTLHLARRFPNSSVVAVSNSKTQKAFIDECCQREGLNRVEVVTADINTFEPPGQFDRMISVEMFEHVRNHEALLQRLSRHLGPEGVLLVHLFCSAGPSYAYEDEGSGDWMARHFFSGGIMPGDDLMLRYQRHLYVDRQWRWSGVHYQKTLEAWLKRLDGQRAAAEAVLGGSRALQRWRMFVMACSELFGYGGGNHWWVSHYRFRHRP